jgi:hypothetical protein
MGTPGESSQLTNKPILSRCGRVASIASVWLTGASSARASLKFLVLMIAMLLSIGALLSRLNPTAAQVGAVSMSAAGKIFFAGGNNEQVFLASTELFDPTTNSFAPPDQTPSLGSGLFGATATLLTSGPNAGKVLIAGGYNLYNLPSSSTELYDPVTNSFALPNQTASMNVGRVLATATALSTGPNAGKVLIAGGSGAPSLASTELYDPETNSFAAANQTASMNVGRDQALATLLTTGPNTGKILIAGGGSSNGAGGIALVSTELYDPLTNSFAPSNQTASMNSSRDRGSTATVITIGPNAGKVLIAGGFEGVATDASPFGPLASTELYDPATNTFASIHQTAAMNNSRLLATATTITTGPNTGKILISGGETNRDGAGHFAVTASTDLYDPILNSFAPPDLTASMNSARSGATAVTLETGPNAGKILIVGGSGGSEGNITLVSTELYDPLTNSFAPVGLTPSMNTARALALAVQLPDTGPSPITFVGVGPLADSRSPVSAVTPFVPSGAQSGDVMLAQLLVFDGNVTNVPSPPTGWTVIRHDAINGGGGNHMTAWLYYKVASSNEPTSYSWRITPQYAAGVMRAWRGASISAPIDKSSGSTGGGLNPIAVAAPALIPSTDNELQVYFYGAQAYQAPTITEPTAITQRLNQMSPREGFTLAFGDLAAPPGGTISPTYPAMASTNIPNGAPPLMSAQAVLLIPLNAGPTPTATVIVRTPTPTFTPSPGPTTPPPTPIQTPATPMATPSASVIRFVANGPLTDSAQPLTAVTVSLPPNVMPGDVLVSQLALWDGVGSNVPTAPAGWTLIRHDSVSNANKITSWLYYHVAGSSEPASYSWHITSQYVAGVMGAWRGAASSPIDQSSGASAAGVSPISAAAPSLTPANGNEFQIYFYASQSAAAPTISEPGAITQRANLKSSKEGFTLAFGDLAAPAKGTASPTYSAMASFASGIPVMTSQAVLLRPGP